MLIKSNKGFTLVELLVSMVLGLIVLSGVSYIYITVVVSTSETLKSTKLNTQLMTIMSVMVNDIRRAGYWENSALAPSSQNPFNVEDETILTIFSSNTLIVDENTDSNGNCILYTYDKNSNNAVDNGAVDNEFFGFRFAKGSNSVQMATNTSLVSHDSCTSSNWSILNEPNLVKITSLTFNPKESECVNSSEPDELDSIHDSDSVIDDDDEKDCYTVNPDTGHVTVETREIVISLAGELVNDSSVKSQITQSVRVRNDVVRIR